MPTVFKAKRLEEQAQEQETSTEAARAARAIADRLGRVSLTYNQVENAFSHASQQDKDSFRRASDNVKTVLESLNSEEMRSQIAVKAAAGIRGAKLMYETGQIEFQQSIDRNLKSAERHIKKSDKTLEKIEEAFESIESAAEKYAKRQHGFRARQILDNWSEKHPTIARKIGALSPQGKVEHANSIIDNMDFFLLQKNYIDLKADQLMLEKLGSASSEISQKQFANAKQILDESSAAESLKRELDERRQNYYVEPDVKSPKEKAPEQKQREEKDDFKQKPSQNGRITLEDFTKDVKSDSRTVNRSWRKEARQYYQKLSEWTGQKNEKIEALLDKLDEDRSMQTAVQVWKEIHSKWIEKSSVLDSASRDRLMIATLSSDDADKAMNVSRESLGLYVMHYKYELLGYGLGNASFKDKNEAAVAKEEGLIDQLKAKEQMYRDLEELEKKKDKEGFKKLVEDIEKAELEINKLLHNRQSILDKMMGRQTPVTAHPAKLARDALGGPGPTKHFLGYYDKLEDIMLHSNNENKFKGENFMWAYWNAIARNSYDNYKLNQAEYAEGGGREGSKRKGPLELHPLESPSERTKHEFEPPPMEAPSAMKEAETERLAEKIRKRLKERNVDGATEELMRDQNKTSMDEVDVPFEVQDEVMTHMKELIHDGDVIYAAVVASKFGIPKEELAPFKNDVMIKILDLRGAGLEENTEHAIMEQFGISEEDLRKATKNRFEIHPLERPTSEDE